MLVAVSAAHGRHAITRAWAEHTASLGFDRMVVAVTRGDDENVRTCGDRGIVVECENEPLAMKFNLALKYAMIAGATRIMILPSDDFASPAWVRAARETEGDYLYPHTCGILDAYTQRAYHITKLSFGTMRYGAGRVVSRKVIDKLGGELWPPLLNKGLDGASHHRIERAGFKIQIVKTEGIPITDVKTDENLWGFRTWENSGNPISADEALHMVSPSVRAQLDAMKR